MIAAETSVRKIYPITTPVVNDWNELFSRGVEQSYRRGQIIFSRNQQHPFVYQVVKGLVAIRSIQNTDVILDAPGKGDLINLDGLFQDPSETYQATALTGSTILKRVPVGDIQLALQTRQKINELVHQHLLNQIKRSQDRIHDLMVLSAPERIIHFLMQYVLKQGRPVGLEWVVQPVLTHQEIGLLTGTGRQTVTTVLNELRAEGVVHFTRNYFIIRNLAKMTALSGC
ncbi:MAG: Crp/Fnr family transcriptional regulator [Saprospiraceae bacterium]|nr:Crp/Fnr family transcriptional regulator [Saprospiraceae bacterium]